MHKRVLRFALLGVVVVLLNHSGDAQPKSITILHTNDIHASFIPHDAFWVKENPKPEIGGFKELFFISDSIRKVYPDAVMLDAGDVMTGNPITERQYGGALGGALFEMMNDIGYDAWCPGNHDFDISQENLRRISLLVKFPTLAANIVDVNGTFPVNNKPYLIIERGGLRIGIIGIMSQELYGLVNQNNLVGIKVLSPIETLQKYIEELDPQTDLRIALTHQGVDQDSLLAASVTGLHIIVGGHSHTRLKAPKIVHDVIIVQTGSNCENLGELEVTVDNGRVTSYQGKLIPLWARKGRPTNRLTALVDSVQSSIDKDYSEVIGILKEDWVRRDSLSGIGYFIANAQREAAHADIGFMNNYGIRRDVSAGPLTKRVLFEVLPFRNILTAFQLSGQQLRSILGYYVETGSRIQIAGMSAVWRKTPGGRITIVRAEVQGRPLDDKRMYICAASDYFVGEAKRYLGLELAQVSFLQQTVFEAVEKAVRRDSLIVPRVPYRFEEVR